MSTRAIHHRQRVLVGAPSLQPASVLRRLAPLRSAAAIAEDVLLLGAVVFSIPFVVLIVGVPVALVLQLVLWLAGLP